VDILRTPDERFENLPDYSFEPHYINVPASDGGELRVHFVDEGPAQAAPILLMHGEPSWSFLYRNMIPILVTAGHRCVVPDLVGFGRLDKPASVDDYSYQRHMDWMRAFMEQLDLRQITLFGQDWGGLLGLRLAAEHRDRFASIVAANTGLPTGDQQMNEAFFRWREFSQTASKFSIGRVIDCGSVSELAPEVLVAYEATFPDESYKAGARIFPALVPITPDDSASAANRQAWESLRHWDKHFLTAFSDGDPITARADLLFKHAIPVAKDQPHTTIEGAGHFLQEDKGEELAKVVVDFLAYNS